MKTKFAVFILTHGRPDNVLTYETLKKTGYNGLIYIVIDDEDSTADKYKEIYKDKVVVFNKEKIALTFDEADNFEDRRSIVYARNATYDIAKKLGITHFIQLDDDYTTFVFTADSSYRYLNSRPMIKDINVAFNNAIELLDSTRIDTIAFSQGGDFIGGENSNVFKKRYSRKAMNSFICRTDRRIKFQGRINEDVNTYTQQQSIGKIFFTICDYRLEQKTTQKNAGGMTDIYLKQGTYIKSFYTVMFQPSSVKVSLMGDVHKRIHHSVKWDCTVPKIIREDYKKS